MLNIEIIHYMYIFSNKTRGRINYQRYIILELLKFIMNVICMVI